MAWDTTKISGDGLVPANWNDMADDQNDKADRTVLAGKGSIMAASAASTPAGLAVGTDDYILVADSGESTGLKWVSGSDGINVSGTISHTSSAGTYEDVDANTITLTPGSYRIELVTKTKGNLSNSSAITIQIENLVPTNTLIYRSYTGTFDVTYGTTTNPEPASGATDTEYTWQVIAYTSPAANVTLRLQAKNSSVGGGTIYGYALSAVRIG